MNRTAALILTLAVALLCTSAEPATLRTKDGHLFEGDIQMQGDDVVTVTPRDVPGALKLEYRLADIAAIAFRPPITGILSGGTLAGDWAVQDVGTVGVVGSGDYAQGLFTLRGEGTLGGKEDAFGFVYQRLPTDGQLIIRIASLVDRDPDSHSLASAGVMIRESLDPMSRYALIQATAAEGVNFLAKPGAAASVAVTPGELIDGAKLNPPCWLKIMKFGNRVVGAQSIDGKKWSFVQNISLEGLHDAYIGMFVASGRPEQLATATLDHVQLTVHGVRGQYFADDRFTDLRLTRIDPNINFTWGPNPPDERMPASGFGVRWTGQLEPPSTDTYALDLRGEAARLWLNDKLVVDTRNPKLRYVSIKLVGGKRYDLRLDYYQAVGKMYSPAQLFWSAPSLQAQAVSTENLYYAPELLTKPATNPSLEAEGAPVARGVLLIDGTFLPGATKSADQKNLAFSYRDKTQLSIPIDIVARVSFRALSGPLAGKAKPKGAGVLTPAGDFTEGEPQEIQTGKIKLNSVLFGVTSIDVATQAAALVYRDLEPSPQTWTIRTTSGGEFHAKSFHLDKDNLIINDGLLGPFTVGWKEVVDITRPPRP